MRIFITPTSENKNIKICSLNVFVPVTFYATAPPTVRYVTITVCPDFRLFLIIDIYTQEIKQI